MLVKTKERFRAGFLNYLSLLALSITVALTLTGCGKKNVEIPRHGSGRPSVNANLQKNAQTDANTGANSEKSKSPDAVNNAENKTDERSVDRDAKSAVLADDYKGDLIYLVKETDGAHRGFLFLDADASNDAKEAAKAIHYALNAQAEDFVSSAEQLLALSNVRNFASGRVRKGVNYSSYAEDVGGGNFKYSTILEFDYVKGLALTEQTAGIPWPKNSANLKKVDSASFSNDWLNISGSGDSKYAKVILKGQDAKTLSSVLTGTGSKIICEKDGTSCTFKLGVRSGELINAAE